MAELKSVIGSGDSDDAVKEIIAIADENGDGEISYEEFVQMMLKLYGNK